MRSTAAVTTAPAGRLLWTGVDEVVEIDPGTWTTLGRRTSRAPSTNPHDERVRAGRVHDLSVARRP